MGPGPPPEHVYRAFGLSVGDAEPLRDGRVWRCGEVVLEPVSDRAHAVWLSRTMAAIDVSVHPSELRVARPVGTSDGRWVIAGWRARRHVPGVVERRPEESVLTAVRLHRTTVTLPPPEFLATRRDVTATAERLAWGEQCSELDETKGGRWFEILAPARRPVTSADQLVHGDLFGTLLFDGDRPPGLVDFVPQFRPAEWGAAVAAVDAVAWGGADGELLHRWSHLPDWSQMLLRATLFRLAFHALHPCSSPVALDGLRRAASEVTELL